MIDLPDKQFNTLEYSKVKCYSGDYVRLQNNILLGMRNANTGPTVIVIYCHIWSVPVVWFADQETRRPRTACARPSSCYLSCLRPCRTCAPLCVVSADTRFLVIRPRWSADDMGHGPILRVGAWPPISLGFRMYPWPSS